MVPTARGLITLLVLGTLSIASAGIVDFNSFSPLNTEFTTVSTGGLDFTSSADFMYVFDGSSPGGNGTPALIVGFGPASIGLTGGGAFELNSFDMAVSWYASAPQDVDVTAFFQGGGSSVQTLTLGSTIQTFNLNLSNVTAVGVSGFDDGYWVMDNVTFNNNTVPEPASLALVASGLILAGLRSRRSFRRN